MSNDDQFRVDVGAPTEPDYLRPVYANHLNVNFTPHDFRFMFALLEIPYEIPPDATAEARLEVHPHAVASVVVPASMMHALMTLLQRQFDQYLNAFGAPGLDPEGPGGTA